MVSGSQNGTPRPATSEVTGNVLEKAYYRAHSRPVEKKSKVEPSYLSFKRPSKPFQRRQWHPSPVLLPGKSQGRRSLVGCSPWGRQESDTTERLHFDFSLSCIGEGNGDPLQCSCLENPRDGGAWWAAICGVPQSRTRLKRLGSSSSSKAIQLSAEIENYCSRAVTRSFKQYPVTLQRFWYRGFSFWTSTDFTVKLGWKITYLAPPLY